MPGVNARRRRPDRRSTRGSRDTLPLTVPGVVVVIAGTVTSVETTLFWPEESVIVAASVTMSPMSPYAGDQVNSYGVWPTVATGAPLAVSATDFTPKSSAATTTG